MPYVAGFCWYDCPEAITMEITTTMEASSGVCQTAVTTRQQLIKLPDTKTITNGECAANVGGNECEMTHFTLHFCHFCFPSAAKQWVTLKELSLVLIDRLSKKQFYQLLYQQGHSNTAWRVCRIVFILEMNLYHRHGRATIQYYHLSTHREMVVSCRSFSVVCCLDCFQARCKVRSFGWSSQLWISIECWL